MWNRVAQKCNSAYKSLNLPLLCVLLLSCPLQDPELLRFVDLECFLWSTVNADLTPMINAGMVFCDRHFGGINYPVGEAGGQAGGQMVRGSVVG